MFDRVRNTLTRESEQVNSNKCRSLQFTKHQLKLVYTAGKIPECRVFPDPYFLVFGLNREIPE